MKDIKQLTIFICHGDFEEAWAESICAEQDRQWMEYERDEDLELEARLGLLAILDAEEDGCDPDDYLPEYASRPYEIQMPEVFEL